MTMLPSPVVDTIAARTALPALVRCFKTRFKSEQIAIARQNLYDTVMDGLARLKHRAESANVFATGTDILERVSLSQKLPLEKKTLGSLQLVVSLGPDDFR